MRAAVIGVGTELVSLGRRDTNSEWLAAELEGYGLEVEFRLSVADDVEAIAAALRAALKRSHVVVMTGGLGPTEDDRTREALGRGLDLPMELDEAARGRLHAMFARYGRRCAPEQDRQAWRPRGAEWIENRLGTAAGLVLRAGPALVCALPGVPTEMRAMFRDCVKPRLPQPGAGEDRVARRTLKVAGRTESSVDRQIRDLYESVPGVRVTILLGREGIELHLRARDSAEGAAADKIEEMAGRMAGRLGTDVYGVDEETLPGVLGGALEARRATVATAESCTAGMLAAALTRVPGSSAWFRGGLVVYADDLKRSLAGVPPGVIDREGAVSAGVACALASGARERCAADYGVGITGIAGPGGGSAAKPVGRVHLAIASGAEGARHWELQQIGGRELVRRRTVTAALDHLRRLLLQPRDG